MNKKVTCIICPIGCEIEVDCTEKDIKNVEGNQCKKGIKYAREEVICPMRTLTTTLQVRNGNLPLVSVKTNPPVPKEKIFDVMDELARIVVKAPINVGDVLVKKILGLDVDVVATKKIDVKER
jgi:CxxC motif-containing protein